MYGEAGDDDLWGDTGNDMIDGGTGNDEIGGGDGTNTLRGGDGNDKIYGGTGVDAIDGGVGNDTIYGDRGNDQLVGGLGNDKLSGGDHSDLMIGGAGNDELSGNEGLDTYQGGTGVDKFFLWDSVNLRDTLVFSLGDSGRSLGAIDLVEGFTSGEDKLDLRSFGHMGFGAIDFAGGGQASCFYDGRYLRIDSNGDRATDMMIEFTWLDSLRPTDLLLA